MKLVACLSLISLISYLQDAKGIKQDTTGTFVLSSQPFPQYGVLERLQVYSKAMCFSKCVRVGECAAVNFDRQSKQCEALEASVGTTLLNSAPVSVKSSGDWVSYHLQDRRPGCKLPWQYVSGSCVQVRTYSFRVSWNSASNYCGNIRGGSILSLRNVPAEVPVKLIGAFGSSCASVISPSTTRTFIGGLRHTFSSPWIWEDGSNITHLPWKTTAPYSVSNRDCLFMSLNTAPIGANVYNDKCSTTIGGAFCFICEKKIE